MKLKINDKKYWLDEMEKTKQRMDNYPRKIDDHKYHGQIEELKTWMPNEFIQHPVFLQMAYSLLDYLYADQDEKLEKKQEYVHSKSIWDDLLKKGI